MWSFPDLTLLFWLAMFGLVCAALAILGLVGGLIGFVAVHVQFV
jgi:hypothetical protein